MIGCPLQGGDGRLGWRNPPAGSAPVPLLRISALVELTLIEGQPDQNVPPAGADAATGHEAASPPVHAVARVYGKPVLEVPTDLYIPPEALEVILEAFEGPLDLLLYLIRKHNLDVLDIPMADLTRQYLEYVDAMRQQWELAAEYLLMAALLIEIKSRMLLPRPPAAAEEEPEDPRAALVKRLLEYEQMKLAAERLLAVPQAGRDFAPVSVKVDRVVLVRLPDVDPEDLRQAWLGLLARAKAAGHHHKVTREQLSVREHMTRVLRSLREHPYLEFRDLFRPERGVPELVVTLLAILELTKEYLVSVTQQAVFAPIYVRLKDGNTDD